MPATLLSIDDLGPAAIDAILARAGKLRAGETASGRGFSMGLVMLQPSLRTRLGFAEATRQLGGHAHVVDTARFAPGTSAPESLEDLLRVVAGMTNLLVVRVGNDLTPFRCGLPAPLINAGDALEHPSQALIDLFAIERECGPIGELRVDISGDLGTRTCRSFLKLLGKRPPAQLRLIAPPTRRGDAARLVAPIVERVDFGAPGSIGEIDVLYLPGLPEEREGDVLAGAAREAYALSDRAVQRLAPGARIFSPMPVIDEISVAARMDPRLCMFSESDDGVMVRMAIVEMMLRGENLHE